MSDLPFQALGQSNQQSSNEIVTFIAQNIESLFQIDAQDAASLLVALRPSVREGLGISVDAATAALERNSRWRHEYLKVLFSKDEVAGQAYHSMMVGLFAAHEPRGLLAFLKAAHSFCMDMASRCNRIPYSLDSVPFWTRASFIWKSVSSAVHSNTTIVPFWSLVFRGSVSHPACNLSLYIYLPLHLSCSMASAWCGAGFCMSKRPFSLDLGAPNQKGSNICFYLDLGIGKKVGQQRTKDLKLCSFLLLGGVV